MSETVAIRIDETAQKEIVAEWGSRNRFYEMLNSLVTREAAGQASLAESSDEMSEETNTRGGDIVEIITASAGVIAAVSPIVIEWIQSFGFEVEIKKETRKNGAVIETVHVRKGQKG